MGRKMIDREPLVFSLGFARGGDPADGALVAFSEGYSDGTPWSGDEGWIRMIRLQLAQRGITDPTDADVAAAAMAVAAERRDGFAEISGGR